MRIAAQPSSMFAVLLATYAAVFLAEIVGDKLLYTTGILATRYRSVPRRRRSAVDSRPHLAAGDSHRRRLAAAHARNVVCPRDAHGPRAFLTQATRQPHREMTSTSADRKSAIRVIICFGIVSFFA